YFSVTLNCTIPTGSSGLFNASINFVNASGTPILTSPISFVNQSLPSPSVNQVVTFTDQKLFNTPAGLGIVGTNQTIRMVGFVEFKAKNDEGPVSISFNNAEISAAPPTATFAVHNGTWVNPDNWSPDTLPGGNSDGIPDGVPHHAGDRARFVGS